MEQVEMQPASVCSRTLRRRIVLLPHDALTAVLFGYHSARRGPGTVIGAAVLSIMMAWMATPRAAYAPPNKLRHLHPSLLIKERRLDAREIAERMRNSVEMLERGSAQEIPPIQGPPHRRSRG